MVTWNKINASAFPELMTEFLTNHPSLESPAKEPPRKKARTGSILEQVYTARLLYLNRNTLLCLIEILFCT